MMIKRAALSLFALSIAAGTCLLPARPAHAATSAEQQLSDAFIRSAVTLSGYTQAIESESPYILAGQMLDTAIQLNPSNAQAWALRAEIADAVGDKDGYERALVGYLGTGVKDEHATYDLIRYRVAKGANTLDAQLRVLEDLLDSEAGRALAPPVRSRLASYASSLGKELLDESARRRWAVEAARSDPANRDAAEEMLALVTELGGDTLRRGTAMVNVIRADPLNPVPRLDLAKLLADEGVYDRAAEQYQVVATRLSPEPLPAAAYIDWAQCLAIVGRDDIGLQLVDEYEKAMNAPKPGEAQAGDAEPAEKAQVPLGIELVRLAILDSEDEGDAAQRAFERIMGRLQDAGGDGDANGDVAQAQADAADQLALVAAVFAPGLEQAAQIVNDHKQAPGESGWVSEVAQGWLALRRGQYNQAEQLLRPVAPRHGLAACGLALAVGQDDAGRARLLQDAMSGLPASSIATLAAGRAMLKLGQTPRPTKTGLAIENLVSKYPQSFWLVDLERTPWLEVRLKIDPARFGPLEPITAEITLWNTSRFPIAIGKQAPIRSKAMILLSAASSGQPLPPMPPIVVDIDRRLTLSAGERIIFDTHLDYHQFGALIAANPGAPFVFDARLIVNPTLTPAGSWLPNGIGGVSEIRNCIVQSKPIQQQDIDPWLDAISSNVTEDKLNALARLAGLSEDTQPDVVGPALLERVRPKLIQAWENASEAEQAWIVLHAVELEKPGTSYPRLLELAKQSDRPLVWLALIVGQANTPGSDILGEAIKRQDMPEVSRFGERMRRLLGEIEKARAASEVLQP